MLTTFQSLDVPPLSWVCLNQPVWHHPVRRARASGLGVWECDSIVCGSISGLYEGACLIQPCLRNTRDLWNFLLLDRSMIMRTLHESPQYYCVIHATRLGDRFRSEFPKIEVAWINLRIKIRKLIRFWPTYFAQKRTEEAGFEPSTLSSSVLIMR